MSIRYRGHCRCGVHLSHGADDVALEFCSHACRIASCQEALRDALGDAGATGPPHLAGIQPGSYEHMKRATDARIYEAREKAMEQIDLVLSHHFADLWGGFDVPGDAMGKLHDALFDYIDGFVWMSASQTRHDHNLPDSAAFRALRDQQLAMMAGEWSDES